MNKIKPTKLKMMSSLFLVVFGTLLHGHHVSVSELVYTPDKAVLECTIQVFATEMEEFVKHKNKDPYFDVRAQSEAVNGEMEKFARSHFVLKVDGLELPCEWKGFNVEGNNLKMHLVYRNVSGKDLSVSNRSFLDVLHGQENIVHLEIHGKRQTGLCTEANPWVRFSLNH